MGSALSDLEAVAAYQMAGQDVGWLLRHWAAKKPEHPFLIWEPRDGRDRTWTYAQFLAEARSIGAGLARRGVGKGDRVMIHADNCPEMVLAWYACALLGAVAVTTNTKSAGPEVEYFAAHARCVAAITQPQHVELVAAHARHLKWIAVTADDSGEPAEPRARGDVGAERIAFADLAGDGAALPDRPAEPMLPVGIMFTSGTTSRPKAVVHTHANVIWASRVGPDNIALGTDDRYLVYTAVLPRERAELGDVERARRRGHDRAHPEVVGLPLLGRGDEARRHALLGDGLHDAGHRREARFPRTS